MSGVAVRNIERAGLALVAALGQCGRGDGARGAGPQGADGALQTPIYGGAMLGASAVAISAPPGANWMVHVAIEQLKEGTTRDAEAPSCRAACSGPRTS